MNNLNFLKPNKENLNLYLVFGALFFALGIGAKPIYSRKKTKSRLKI